MGVVRCTPGQKEDLMNMHVNPVVSHTVEDGAKGCVCLLSSG